MKKLLVFLLIPALLCPCAAGAENPRYLALTFEGCPPEAQPLLEGLEARGVRATFFLRGEDSPQGPRLHSLGHELGILSRLEPGLSRREIAREIRAVRELLPANCRVRLLRHEAEASDGFYQVAEALGLVISGPSLDPWAVGPVGRTVLDRAADGDVLNLDAAANADRVLDLISLLQGRGFTFVTVSELARLRGVSLRPGDRVRRFPAGEE